MIIVMAHLIDSMASVVNATAKDKRYANSGELPWHRLGTQLDSVADANTMIVAAGLGWPTIIENVYDQDMNEIADFRLTRRGDTREVLGIVTKDYTPLQNVDAFRMIDKITMDPHGPKYETAGSLSGGKRIWALARLPEFIEVLPGDHFGSYLLITTGHDGKNALRIMLTNIRVVCNNTLTSATRDENRGIRLTHSQDILSKADDVRAVLGMYHREAQETAELYRMLAKKQLKTADIDTVVKAIFGEAGTDAKRDSSGAKRAQVYRLMEEGLGADIRGLRGTAWGTFNAIAEYCDHYHGATSKADDADGKRLQSMWFGGTIQTRKAAALELLVAA